MSGSTVVFHVLFLLKNFFLYFTPDKICVFCYFLSVPLEVCQFYWYLQRTSSFLHWFSLLFFSFLFHWFLFLPLLFLFFTFFGFILLFSFLDSSCGYLDSLRHFCFFNITSGEWKSQVPAGPALTPHLSDSRWGEVRAPQHRNKVEVQAHDLILTGVGKVGDHSFFPLVFD